MNEWLKEDILEGCRGIKPLGFSYIDLNHLVGVINRYWLDWYDFEMHTYQGKIYVYVDDSDLFAWGYSGSVPMVPSDFKELVKCCEDLKAIGDHLYVQMFAVKLFCCRKMKSRPQGAQYNAKHKDMWHLYDECGPEKEVGIGNPCKPGEYEHHPKSGARAPKRIPIVAAKRMAHEYGYDMVAIYGFTKDFKEGWTATYGRTKELCRKVAKWTKGELK